MPLRKLEDLPVSGKRVFIRADLNVPLRDGQIAETRRIDAALPTIAWVLERGGRPIVASHLGRPKGKPDPTKSLRPIATYLASALDAEVQFADDCIGPAAVEQSRALQGRRVLLLENLRFHPGETSNDDDFAHALAALADVYVNDAFGAAHRAHASTTGMPRFVPYRGIGLLMRREIDHLKPLLLGRPTRPFTVILGGAKVSDKIGVLQNMLDRLDHLVIGGAMAYTFLAAKNREVGASRVEENMLDVAQQLLSRAKQRDIEVVLPIDHVVARAIEPGIASEIVEGDIPEGMIGVDIGPKTVERFGEVIAASKTIFWNGPLGVFEVAPFHEGTFAIADRIAHADAFRVVGGGDSVAAIVRSGYADNIDHLSTGGGAALEFLEGREMPALRVLEVLDRSTRIPIFCGNWKMNGTVAETRDLLRKLARHVDGLFDREIVVAPPMTALTAAAAELHGTAIHLGAQNVHWAKSGAFTGEVSPQMLLEIGCRRVIVGHSERRQLFGETDTMVNQRARAAVACGLGPIVCVGEQLEDRQAGRANEVVERQVRAALKDLTAADIEAVCIAYEPIWAIGTGVNASPAQAQEMHVAIRRVVEDLSGDDVARRLRILYGGSVKPENIDELMAEADVDGVLVGGASLSAESFARIVDFQTLSEES